MNHSNHSATSTEELPPTHKLSPVAPATIEREFKFTFKKQTVTDELGMEVKRAPLILSVPVPTYNGLLDAFEDTKVSAFVLDLVEEAIKDQVRSLLSDVSENRIKRQEDLDLSKLTLSYIANLPKTERTGGGISKDTWEEWEKDYIEVMVQLRNKDPKAMEKVTKAAKYFTGRFNQCRTDKPVLKFLRDQLGIWMENTQNLEEFSDLAKYLDDRATELLNKDNTSALENLF